MPYLTATGRQPVRLPFGFSAWRTAALAVLLAGAPFTLARAEMRNGKIVIVAVDSSWVPAHAPRATTLSSHLPTNNFGPLILANLPLDFSL